MSTATPQSEPPHTDAIVLLYPQLKSLGPDFSNVQLLRMERVGRFPKRFYLSAKRPCWYKRDIIQWIEQRAAASYVPPGVPRDEKKWKRSIKQGRKKAKT